MSKHLSSLKLFFLLVLLAISQLLSVGATAHLNNEGGQYVGVDSDIGKSNPILNNLGNENHFNCCDGHLTTALSDLRQTRSASIWTEGFVLSKGGKVGFIVNSRGTAVRNSASGARRDLEAGGYPGRVTTETLENGTLHSGELGRDGPMDVRIMNGQANGGPYKGPRIRTTRSGSANDGVRSDGSRFRNSENKIQRL